jgi:hypothetical protein
MREKNMSLANYDYYCNLILKIIIYHEKQLFMTIFHEKQFLRSDDAGHLRSVPCQNSVRIESIDFIVSCEQASQS